MIHRPHLKIFLPEVSGPRDTKSIWDFDIPEFGARDPSISQILLARSFCTLNCIISEASLKATHILLDGRVTVPISIDKNTSFLKLDLQYDLEYHILSIVVEHKYALTVQITCEHRYEFTPAQGAKYVTPKWKLETLTDELETWAPLFEPSSQALIREDPITRAIGRNREIPEDWQEAVFRTSRELARSVLDAPAQYFASDFPISERSPISVDRVLLSAKQNPQALSPHIAGPIVFRGTRYSMPSLDEEYAPTSGVDLSEVRRCIEFAISGLLIRGSNLASIEILMAVKARLPKFNSYLPHTGTLAVVNFFKRPMKTSYCQRVQQICARLVALSRRNNSRALPRGNALTGLSQGIRDFDVFEKVVFAVIGLAMGYTKEEVISSRGILDSKEHVVIDMNSEKARRTANLLLGWRDKSIQPSGYRPDLVVLFDKKNPVLVDAKFRIPMSLDQIAAPDGLKDLQAYMDEYGHHGCIVASPLIPAEGIRGRVSTKAIYIQGNGRDLKQRTIAVLEVSNSKNSGVIDNARDAVTTIARSH